MHKASHTRSQTATRIIQRGAVGVAIAALLAASQVALATAAAADDPIAGALTSGDPLFPNQGNGGYDALHYDVELDVDVAVSTTPNAVATTTFADATTTIEAQTTGAPLSSYAFDFQGSTSTLANATLNVNWVTVNGVPATFTRIEETTVTNATTDRHKLVVTPTTPVAGTFTTVVNYSGTPVAHTDTDESLEGWNNTTDGATFMGQPIGSMTAYPNNNTPGDKATYTFSVEIPTKLSTSATAVSANPGLKPAAVASNGELTSRTPSADGTRTTWLWTQEEQMASELALISIGRYDVYESSIQLASGRTLPEWSFIDPAISVQSQNATRATRAQMKAILDHLESKYGPYPGNSIGLVTDIVPGGINYALETQDRPFFPTSASRGTMIHELMHMWWGDAVSPTSWIDIWLNEGPATYSEPMVNFESAGTTTNSTESVYYSAWNTGSSTWSVPTAGMTQASQLYGSQVYARGAWTLEALKTAIGTAAFNELIREWIVRYNGTSRTSADFIDLAEEISGRELTAFLSAWLYGTTKAPWPAKFNLTLAGPTAPVAEGSTATYTLTNRNTGRVSQAGSVVEVDVSGILDKATLGTLPTGVTLSGSTLTWAVPTTATGASISTSFDVTVNAGTAGSTLGATARASTLGSTCVTCASSIVIGAQPVSPSAAPTIDGTPTVAQTLTAVTEGWAADTTFGYQWLADGTPIIGATASTYVVDGFSVGLPVTVRVTGSKDGLSPVTLTSAATANVSRYTQDGPLPVIVGTPKFGVPLSIDLGSGWAPGTYFTYQWAANGTNVSAANGGTGPTFVPAIATQLGQAITVTVTATKFGTNAVTRTSLATAGVVAGEFALAPTPVPTGTKRAESPLNAGAGQWDDGTTLTYAWSINGSTVGTAVNFTPTLAQIGSELTVTVTGTKPGYPTTTRTSAPITVLGLAQALTPTPTIAGVAKEGEVLTATAGTWDDGVELAYQWLADDVAIEGATAASFTLTGDQAGANITVAVTGTKTNYETVTRTSEPTAPVLGAVVVDRLAGADRFSTAVEISGAFEPGVSRVYLVTGGTFADALSASSAAAHFSGPVLLTRPGALPSVVADELTRLDPDEIVIVGGEASVTTALQTELAAYAPLVRRLGGADRFATSRLVTADAFDGADTVYLSTGFNFPDALAATPAAASFDGPVVLVRGTASALDTETLALLEEWDVTTVKIAGESASVSVGIETQLDALYTVKRNAGPDRYSTSVAINADDFSSATTVYLATGQNYPDALAGGARAGFDGAPLFTVQPDCVPQAVLDAIADLEASKVVLLGGEPTLGASVASLTPCG